MRSSTICVVILTAGIGLGLFQLKYKVMSLEHEHKKIKRSIQSARESIHVLKAEWAHLNDPKRLQMLSQKHLDIHPISAKQMVSLKTVAGPDADLARFELDQLVADVAAALPINDVSGGER